MNQKEQLKQWTTLVADTGEIEEIKKYKPQDATTNPSLILKAAEDAQYRKLIDDALEWGDKQGKDLEGKVDKAVSKVLVNFGTEILSTIEGRVSTEVDAALSFDVEGTVRKAKELIELYKEQGIDRKRILIKVASTWEGFQAVRRLEADGIHCNMTLIFGLPQAIMAAEAGATLVSPFVGRILDWYKKSEGVDGYPAAEDPGVKSVQEIYSYFKTFDLSTQVMGASFRNKDEILQLAGCDLLTISPQLLKELSDSNETIQRKLEPKAAREPSLKRHVYSESEFRWALNEDAMATEKLAEGIRKFAADLTTLEKSFREELQGAHRK